MNCHEVTDYMQRFLDHDLNAAEIEEMYAHIRECTACADMFERLQQLSTELENLPKITPPYSLVDAIMPRLEQIELVGANPVQSAGRQAPDTLTSGAAAGTSRVKGSPLRKRFAYRIGGGVVAAGILIGALFILNPPKTADLADDSLLKLEMNSSANKSNGASNEAAANKMMANESAADRNDTANATTEQPAVDDESTSAADGMQADDAAADRAADDTSGGAAGSFTDEASPEPKAEVTSDQAPAATDIQFGAETNSRGSAQADPPMTGMDNAAADQAADADRRGESEKADVAKHSDQAASADGNDSKSSLIIGPVIPQTAAAPSADNGLQTGAASDTASAADLGKSIAGAPADSEQTQGFGSKVTADVYEYVSPSGMYKAIIQHQSVIVVSLDKPETPLFTSAVKQGPIVNLTWSGDETTIQYEVLAAEKTHYYRITLPQAVEEEQTFNKK